MYKQVLALGQASAYQDLDLAEGYHEQAQALEECLGEDQKKRLAPLRKLAGALLAVYRERRADAGKERALAGLRKTLDGLLAASAGRDIERDDLEYLLFAARLLVVEGSGCRSRWHLQDDAELLLKLCRTVLYKRSEQVPRYLRQYYDAALRALLHVKPTHVQAFVEVVWEATTGTAYSKPAMPMPTLAFYVLDGRLHAFLDVPARLSPAGLSKHYALDEDYALERLREAGRAREKLTLPTELTRELARLRPLLAGVVDGAPGAGGVPRNGRTYLVVHWQDPLYGLGRAAKGAKKSAARVDRLPFVLPGFGVSARR
jgi:hypothetical protein